MKRLQHTTEPVSPWRAGWNAARANLIPGLVLQLMAVALVGAYYGIPEINASLQKIARLKANGGFLFSANLGMVCCGLFPWMFRMLIPSLRPKKAGKDLLFSFAWWGCMGVQTDAFYRLQTLLWGAGSSAHVVALKVVIDMLVYTPFLVAPMNSISHLWKARGFDSRGTWMLVKAGGYRNIVLPNLVMNWIIWTPGAGIIYSLPPLLQFPMACLISCFWSLICAGIAAENSTLDTRLPSQMQVRENVSGSG